MGVKYKKIVYDNTNTITYTQQYCGQAVFINNELQYITMPDGRLTPEASGGYQYEYYLKDHLGNIMVTFTDNNNDQVPEILTTDHYYPFGLTLPDLSYQASGTTNLLKYNGKEFQNDHDLNVYDYGARMYDPVIGRFGTQDPLAEQMRRWSTYNYGFDNPIRFVDIDGMKADDVPKDVWGRDRYDESGNYIAPYMRGDKNSNNDVLAHSAFEQQTSQNGAKQENQGNEGDGGKKEKKKNEPKNAQELFEILLKMKVGDKINIEDITDKVSGVTVIRMNDGYNIKLSAGKRLLAGFAFDPENRFTLTRAKWVDNKTDIIIYRECHFGEWQFNYYIHNDAVRFKLMNGVDAIPYKFGGSKIGDGKW